MAVAAKADAGRVVDNIVGHGTFTYGKGIAMRTIAVLIGTMILCGCASPSASRTVAPRDGVAKPSLLQRLGLGRPIGEKRKTVVIQGGAPETEISNVPLTVESGPSLGVEPGQPRPGSSPAPNGAQ